MNARIIHPFYGYISNFSLSSIIYWIAFWSQDLFINQDNKKNINKFFSKKTYTILDGKQKIRGETNILQTYLIDILYEAISFNNYGTKEMTKEESLHLINLYNDYYNNEWHPDYGEVNDVVLYVFGMYAEQKRFQKIGKSFFDFSREKYILDDISCKMAKKVKNINLKSDFVEYTNHTIEEYSELLLYVLILFTVHPYITLDDIKAFAETTKFNFEQIYEIINCYSAYPDEIRKSLLKRQSFYATPFIKENDKYYCSNIFLVKFLFENGVYWRLRNIYLQKKTTGFTVAFGEYFEEYVSEILKNCLSDFCYHRIKETPHDKRADWYMKLGDYEFIIEQKSSISLLEIKQTKTNIDALAEHINKVWGKAIKQLNQTEKALKIKTPIKIVLTYEGFYESICLDKFFEHNKTIENDKRYWLVSISEFETLLYLYKTNSPLAIEIIDKKYKAKMSQNHAEKSLEYFFEEYNIDENLYLKGTKIHEKQFERVHKNVMQKWNEINQSE